MLSPECLALITRRVGFLLVCSAYMVFLCSIAYNGLRWARLIFWTLVRVCTTLMARMLWSAHQWIPRQLDCLRVEPKATQLCTILISN